MERLALRLRDAPALRHTNNIPHTFQTRLFSHKKQQQISDTDQFPEIPRYTDFPLASSKETKYQGVKNHFGDSFPAVREISHLA